MAWGLDWSNFSCFLASWITTEVACPYSGKNEYVITICKKIIISNTTGSLTLFLFLMKSLVNWNSGKVKQKISLVQIFTFHYSFPCIVWTLLKKRLFFWKSCRVRNCVKWGLPIEQTNKSDLEFQIALWKSVPISNNLPWWFESWGWAWVKPTSLRMYAYLLPK